MAATAVAFVPGEWTTVGVRRIPVPDEMRARFPLLSQEAYNVLLESESDSYVISVKESGSAGAGGACCLLSVLTSPTKETPAWTRARHYIREGTVYVRRGVTWNPPKELAGGFHDLTDEAWDAVWHLTKAGRLVISAKEEHSFDDDCGDRARLHDLELQVAGATGAPVAMKLHYENWPGGRLVQHSYI